jgi:hypothetical protein
MLSIGVLKRDFRSYPDHSQNDISDRRIVGTKLAEIGAYTYIAVKIPCGAGIKRRKVVTVFYILFDKIHLMGFLLIFLNANFIIVRF